MAVRITFKRSSIPNKRPTAQLLEPGEVALNTNALTPGLFFEADNDSVVKVGPTAVSTEAPVLYPALGENWYNEVTGELSIGTLSKMGSLEVQNIWQRVSSPYLGGTNGYVVFVAPEFPNATDNLNNTGQANPFQTLNRAIIEVAKQSITRSNELDDGQNNRYTIVVAPGRLPVYNDPGLPLPTSNDDQNAATFSVNFDNILAKDGEVVVKNLTEFNPSTGGLLLPRGTSILGMELRKTNLLPTYVPTYVSPVNGAGINQPITGIIKWTGNSTIEDLTFRDKNPEVYVNQFATDESGEAILISTRPHGLSFNDQIDINFAPAADQTPINPALSGINPGPYFVDPIDLYRFRISITTLRGDNPQFIERGQLPLGDQGLGYILEGTYNLKSHHRLRCLYNATLDELTEFYQKVQTAFPRFFEGKIDQANVINPGETEIVAPTFVSPAGNRNLESNLNSQASPYWLNCSVKSMYGLCGVEQDGYRVSGFRSAQATQITVASLQRDPAAYEIYYTIQDPATGNPVTGWYTLAEAAWNTLAPSVRPQFYNQVPTAYQLEILNDTSIQDIRYVYRTVTNPQGLSYGIVDSNKDFRHFGFLAKGPAYVQVDAGWCICTAVGFWALNGAKATVTNSSNNFGSVAVRSEGFAGIGTLGGALPEDTGFVFSGIRMPQTLLPSETTRQQIYSLNANVVSVIPEPETPEDADVTLDPTLIQLVNLGQGFEPISLLPFSLAPGTAVWIVTPGALVRGFLADDGLTTAILNEDGTTTLRIRRIDSSIPMTVDPVGWNAPFIRRFNDERSIEEQSYSLILSNTNPGHRPPTPSSILRITQTTPSNNTKLIRPRVQFDPGPNGGWGRIFQVIFSEADFIGNSGQVNEVMINRFGNSKYYTALTLTDGGRPWLAELKYAHGSFTTYEARNWYAAANDLWTKIYYSDRVEPINTTDLVPTDFNSVFAGTACTEIQVPVDKTFQGQYGADPFIPEYEDDSYYYRGSQIDPSNYNFDYYYNEDNGTPNFGLLRYTQNTSVTTLTTAELKADSRVLNVQSVSNIPNPKSSFVVVKLRNANSTQIEYVQVLGIDAVANQLIVSRGLYGTAQAGTWPVGTGVVLQTSSRVVDPADYDVDWMTSKRAMIRFLQVMGYDAIDIQTFLHPRPASTRNVVATEFNLTVKSGYAVANGPWAFEFNQPSVMSVGYHTYHSVGYYDYARGLPQYQNSPIPTKQYFDFLSTSVWGSNLQLIGSDERGDIILGGPLRDQSTGRPYGSISSNISTYTHTEAGGLNEAGTVQQIDTGEGLIGGPISVTGTISLAPANIETIGGIKPGPGLAVSPDGTLTVQSDIGTVTSITAGIGLEGGTITSSGTIDLKPPTPASAGENAAAEIGGIYPNFGLNFNPDTGFMNVNITDSLTGAAKNFAISQYAANVLYNQVQALTGANILAGTFNAATGLVVTTTPAGASKGFVAGQNVPAPSAAIDNYYLIVTVGGNNAKPPLPPGPSQASDWYICQAESGTTPAWILIDYDFGTTTAGQVVVIPPISGIETANNVQAALQAIELQVQDRIEFVQVQDEDNTNALFADVTPASQTSNDGTTLKIGVTTASLTSFGVTKLTNDFTGTSQTLALTQSGANSLNAKVDALTGANVLAGTYNANTGTVTSVTPAGSQYLTVGQNCPPASRVPDNYYVLVTVQGTKGPPGAVVPPTGVQSGDWFIVEKENGTTPAWVTIDFENNEVTATQVKIVPAIPGISSSNVQGALSELVTKNSNCFTDIRSFTNNTSGIKVTNTNPSLNGRESTLQLLPATSQDIGGVFVGPNTGINLTPSGGLGLNPATTTKIGGVIVGEGLEITPNGVLSVQEGSSPAILIDDISPQFNGSRTVFSLTSAGKALTPANAYNILIAVGGVIQSAVLAYNTSGSQITFTSAPGSGLTFYGVAFAAEVAFTRPLEAAIPIRPIDNISIQFNGTAKTFNLTSGGIPLTPMAAYTIIVSLGGVWQAAGTNYSVSGSTITFTVAPNTGTEFYGISVG